MVGSLVRVVGEQPHPQNAPVSRGVFPLPVWAGVGKYCNVFFSILAVRRA